MVRSVARRIDYVIYNTHRVEIKRSSTMKQRIRSRPPIKILGGLDLHGTTPELYIAPVFVGYRVKRKSFLDMNLISFAIDLRTRLK